LREGVNGNSTVATALLEDLVEHGITRIVVACS